jgi:hypothetical protein
MCPGTASGPRGPRGPWAIVASRESVLPMSPYTSVAHVPLRECYRCSRSPGPDDAPGNESGPGHWITPHVGPPGIRLRWLGLASRGQSSRGEPVAAREVRGLAGSSLHGPERDAHVSLVDPHALRVAPRPAPLDPPPHRPLARPCSRGDAVWSRPYRPGALLCASSTVSPRGVLGGPGPELLPEVEDRSRSQRSEEAGPVRR